MSAKGGGVTYRKDVEHAADNILAKMEDSRRARLHARTARLRARFQAVEAFRHAAKQYEMQNNQFFGYATAVSRQGSLIKHLSGISGPQGAPGTTPAHKSPPTTAAVAPIFISAEEEAFSKRAAAGPRGVIRRGLLADPPPFTRTSRGVLVRRGGHQGTSQYAEIKATDLRSAYALYLLESDLNHYRHLYLENDRRQQVEGRLKYFSAPPCKSLVPLLWLERPWTAVENLRRAKSNVDDTIAMELDNLPALRQRFTIARKQEVDRVRTRPRSQAVGISASTVKQASAEKTPAGLLPGRGAFAALKAAAEQRVEAASARKVESGTSKAERLLKRAH